MERVKTMIGDAEGTCCQPLLASETYALDPILRRSTEQSEDVPGSRKQAAEARINATTSERLPKIIFVDFRPTEVASEDSSY